MSKRKAKDTPVMSATLRQAIEDSGQSLYRVAKDAGIGYATLHRFMTGKRAIALANLDKLCAYLGLELRKDQGPARV
jgi:DNA-binding Xre family transcriptional regulator